MRVLVISLNRSGSSVAAAIAAAHHGLANYGEIYAEGNTRISRREDPEQLLKTTDNFVAKIMMYSIEPRRALARAFDLRTIDKIIMTTRNVEDQIASWLYVNHVYTHFVKNAVLSFQEHQKAYQYVGDVDISNDVFSGIKRQFRLFREVNEVLDKLPKSQVCTIPYEVYNGTNESAAQRLSKITGWDIKPTIFSQLTEQRTNRNYRRCITNYKEMAMKIQDFGITY